MQFIVVVSASVVWGFLFVAAAPIIMLDDSLISANASGSLTARQACTKSGRGEESSDDKGHLHACF
ncbi:hypothetical protein EV715DRAFT_209527 [Schizophyllum commune]